MRKKAREVNLKARKFEEDLESSQEQNATLTSELESLRESLHKIESRVATAEKAAKSTREELETERKNIDPHRPVPPRGRKVKVALRGLPAPLRPLDAPRPPALLPPRRAAPLQQHAQVLGHVGPRGQPAPRRPARRRGPHPGDLGLLLPGDSRPTSRRSGPGQPPLRTPTDPSLAGRHPEGTASPPMGLAHGGAGTPPLGVAGAVDPHGRPGRHAAARRRGGRHGVAQVVAAADGGGAHLGVARGRGGPVSGSWWSACRRRCGGWRWRRARRGRSSRGCRGSGTGRGTRWWG